MHQYGFKAACGSFAALCQLHNRIIITALLFIDIAAKSSWTLELMQPIPLIHQPTLKVGAQTAGHHSNADKNFA